MPNNHTFISLPDARQGSGYVSLKGTQGQHAEEELWPYTEVPEDEGADDEEVQKDREAISKKDGEWVPTDHINRANYKSHAFVKSSTRGLTGIMACVEPEDVLEALAGAIGQASPSYNVSGPDGTTRTRPGRRTGSKRGYFSAPIPKETDPQIKAYSLEDIADNEEDRAIKHSDMVRKKIRRKNSSQGMKNATLRAYIRDVLGADGSA